MPRPVVTAILTLALGLRPEARSAGADDSSKPGDDGPKAFRVEAGLAVVKVAAEPIVSDPVAACYDADGRLFVAEFRGPSAGESPGGCIRRLFDDDGDGVYERSAVFCDGLAWPSSLLPHQGGLLAAVAPDILFLKDTNGDGTADVRSVVLTGFGTGEVDGRVNGLCWGIDGWVYGLGSLNGGTIRSPSQPAVKPVSLEGRDFRFKPDGSAVAPWVGGGRLGQAFDDYGYQFFSRLDAPAVQTVISSHYLDRAEYLPRPRSSALLADSDGPRSAYTGLAVYRGLGYPSEFRGSLLTCATHRGAVERRTLARGAGRFEAGRAATFLQSDDPMFRPIQLVPTPDGTLLVLDLHREPINREEAGATRLDLTRGAGRGRIFEVVPTGFDARRRRKPALSRAEPARLVASLGDRDAWWRETAQRLLLEQRPANVAPTIKSMMKERPCPQALVAGMSTLEQLGLLDDEQLAEVLTDPEPGVRVQAARIGESRSPDLGHDRSIYRSIANLVYDPDPLLRFQSTLSVGVTGRMGRSRVISQVIFTDGTAPWFREAVLLSSGDFIPQVFASLVNNASLLRSEEGPAWLEKTASAVAQRNQPDDFMIVMNWLAVPQLDLGVSSAAIRGLRTGIKIAGRGSPFGDARLRTRLGILLDRASETAVSDRPEVERINNLRMLGLASPDTVLLLLPELLGKGQSPAIQAESIRALQGCSDRLLAGELLSRWKSMTPELRDEAVDVLLDRADNTSRLLDAVEKGVVAPSELPADARRRLRGLEDGTLRTRAVRLIGAAEGS